MHRCLGSLVSELDAPWAGYVEGLERLVRVEADGVLREIEKSVTLAVMYALENHLTLENKVSSLTFMTIRNYDEKFVCLFKNLIT